MLYKRNFSTGVQLTKVYLIHEGSDKKDAAASAAKQIFRCQRIGNLLRIKALPLI